MLPQHQSQSVSSHDDKKATELQKFLEEISFLVGKYGEAQDSSIQQAVQELQNIQSQLEQGTKQRSRDWGAIGKTLLQAAQWIKIIYDFLQE